MNDREISEEVARLGKERERTARLCVSMVRRVRDDFEAMEMIGVYVANGWTPLAPVPFGGDWNVFAYSKEPRDPNDVDNAFSAVMAEAS